MVPVAMTAFVVCSVRVTPCTSVTAISFGPRNHAVPVITVTPLRASCASMTSRSACMT